MAHKAKKKKKARSGSHNEESSTSSCEIVVLAGESATETNTATNTTMTFNYPTNKTTALQVLADLGTSMDEWLSTSFPSVYYYVFAEDDHFS